MLNHVPIRPLSYNFFLETPKYKFNFLIFAPRNGAGPPGAMNRDVMKVIFLTIGLAIGLVLVALLLLGVRALFVKGGRFPSSHVCGNAKLQRRIARK